MLGHGVISAGGPNRRFLGFDNQEITPLSIFHHPPGTTAAYAFRPEKPSISLNGKQIAYWYIR
jgi:hypothetical protein